MKKPKQMKPQSNHAQECNQMARSIRMLLAMDYPETSQEIALLVMLRLSAGIAVNTLGKEYAPAAISRLINHFLLADHYK